MSRILILSDIHANMEALDAVLADAREAGAVWCLGDIVGYGPEPAASLEWVRGNCDIVLSGNHDYAVFDLTATQSFNPAAAAAAKWTRDQLTEEQLAYLRSLDSRIDCGGVTLAHGSPADPIWTYILTVIEARDAFEAFDGDLCLVGHTHVACYFLDNGRTIQRAVAENDVPLALSGGRYIVNPGSVGQPRDRDPRAAYLWYDDEAGTVTWKRTPYDILTVQAKIRAAGLPERLASRLTTGT
jgi:diadenosine tetraphosphatase ApaH/serine/threonine PP2A family protein phosphatase